MKLKPEEKKIICDFFELVFSKFEEMTKQEPPPPELEKPLNRLIPVTLWNKYHEWPTVSGPRSLIFSRPNGFEKCIQRAGRRIVIDEQAFFEWLKNQPK